MKGEEAVLANSKNSSAAFKIAVQSAVWFNHDLALPLGVQRPLYSSAQPSMRKTRARRNFPFSMRMNAFAKANPSELAQNSFT
jgi:hypothetical protein